MQKAARWWEPLRTSNPIFQVLCDKDPDFETFAFETWEPCQLGLRALPYLSLPTFLAKAWNLDLPLEPRLVEWEAMKQLIQQCCEYNSYRSGQDIIDKFSNLSSSLDVGPSFVLCLACPHLLRNWLYWQPEPCVLTLIPPMMYPRPNPTPLPIVLWDICWDYLSAHMVSQQPDTDAFKWRSASLEAHYTTKLERLFLTHEEVQLLSLNWRALGPRYRPEYELKWEHYSSQMVELDVRFWNILQDYYLRPGKPYSNTWPGSYQNLWVGKSNDYVMPAQDYNAQQDWDRWMSQPIWKNKWVHVYIRTDSSQLYADILFLPFVSPFLREFEEAETLCKKAISTSDSSSDTIHDATNNATTRKKIKIS